MSAVLGSVGETAAGALLDPDVESILEEKNQLISRQYAEIERLQSELAEVVGERDALLCEVSKFKFEREMTDLKRLQDDRCVRVLLLALRSFSSSHRVALYARGYGDVGNEKMEIRGRALCPYASSFSPVPLYFRAPCAFFAIFLLPLPPFFFSSATSAGECVLI